AVRAQRLSHGGVDHVAPVAGSLVQELMPNPFRSLNRSQRHVFVAALAGWSLDAFDFFIFVFALKSIAGDFHTSVKAVSEGIFLTLAMRPVGALFFGWLAERYGRRPVLMVNIVSYSVFELASAFAPDLRTLLIL